MVFDPIWSNTDELLSINKSANIFVFGEFAFSFPTLGNSNHIPVPVSIDFPSNSQSDATFHCIAYDYSRFDWDCLYDHLRNVPWEDILKLGASAAGGEFCEWAEVGNDVYIPHIRSSLTHLHGLKLPNLYILIKQKSSLLPRNLALVTFGKLLMVFSTKINLLYWLYSTTRRRCLLHLIKQNCLLKTFLITLILMTQVSLYLFSLLGLVWGCIIFL